MRLRHLSLLRITSMRFITFSPDGRTLATLGWKVRLWDAATGRLLQELEPHGMWDVDLEFSPDGKKLVTAHGSQIHVWDLSTGKGRPLWTDKKYREYAARVAVSPDGKVLAVGGSMRKGEGDDAQVRLYDFKDLKELALLEPPDGDTINALAFSSDGKQPARRSRAPSRPWGGDTRRFRRTGGTSSADGGVQFNSAASARSAWSGSTATPRRVTSSASPRTAGWPRD
jgi:WD40 repeat protein